MRQLRHKYGDRSYRFHVLLLQRVSPAASVAWYLGVPPAVALARKPEQFDLAGLADLAACYRKAAVALGVSRLEGAAPAEELTALMLGELRRIVERSSGAGRFTRRLAPDASTRPPRG